MKNIILIGACRSGKTTLSQIILREFPMYQYISRDIIFDSYCNAKRKYASELSKNTGVVNFDINVNIPKYMVGFLYDYMVSDYPNINVIVDAGDITLTEARDIAKRNKKQRDIIIALGYPNINEVEKIEQVRRNDGVNDWTRAYSSTKLRKFFEYQIEYSKELEKECSKYNVIFIDTSYDREEKFRNFIKFIKANNS